jgi:hypothetical protein
MCTSVMYECKYTYTHTSYTFEQRPSIMQYKFIAFIAYVFFNYVYFKLLLTYKV